MKKENITKKRIMIFLALLLIPLTSADSGLVGVSPANINFENVLRGGYAERPIIITVDSDEEARINISARGEIANWLTFPKDNLTLVKGSPRQVMISISPPSDTPNGIYEGFLRIRSTELGEALEGFATGLVIPTLDVYITVEVTDQEIVECDAKNFIIESAEEGDDILFSLDVKNNGNIRFFPEINFDIWDVDNINIVKQFRSDEKEVNPTQQETINIKIPSDDLELGQYWVDVNAVECFSKRTLTFDILEEGALRANGILEGVLVDTWADIGDIVPITANFKNTGEKSLDARFSGKITLNNKVVQLLESDEELFTRIGEESTFTFFFTPREAGRYVITGRVFYDGKRTFEQTGILNVREAGSLDKVIRAGIYIALIGVISFLIFKIRKERRMLGTLKRRYR